MKGRKLLSVSSSGATLAAVYRPVYSQCTVSVQPEYSDHTPVNRTEWPEPQSVETCRSEKRASQAENFVLPRTEIFLSS